MAEHPAGPGTGTPPPPTWSTHAAPPLNHYDYRYAHWTAPPAKPIGTESQATTVVRVVAAIAGGTAGAALLLAIFMMLSSMYGGPNRDVHGYGLVMGLLGYIPLSIFCTAVLPLALPKPWWTRGLVGSALVWVGFSGLLIILGHYA
ncbi:hypothetical protein [Mycolicibacterium alvei]|uniref:Uncharacterized protein n=1 Tax=Mycolicibacterium alvei TaxID=67081 RepID=A0A6N4V1W2_9MYCO|nr:hypothetical protein [Mycolicibacterium alvei]MCV7003488.1 hypothetical protein [Mycolicibacterium alvei]BBX30558.1 hypothetical protein MALV_56830 [Mycolicibacterium alvei]